MYIRYEKKVIELTKTEKAEAEKYGSQQYIDLMNARRDNPGFREVEIKVKKTAKTPLDSLNLPTIRAYVKANGSPDQKQTFLTISTATIDDNGIYHAAQDFFSIKKWFLAEFPLYKAALENDAPAVLIGFEAMIDITKGHSVGKRYPEVKKWFLDRYPEFAEFGMTEVQVQKYRAERAKLAAAKEAAAASNITPLPASEIEKTA